ncbi:MAG TPA: 2-oxoacid:acceptor oxidoreductase subunit alpha [Lentisphaeria bacterium]|nr:MAG: hypothetical protein A2X47_09905 [Lentisphaerae bacterium GWF2_38_69]HBM17324.1 2-oxoacid:acceptor oxidoreductase subunit alpha [Lentisphaeria bacterium]
MSNIFNELTIMLAGEAGAGVQSTEAILLSLIKNAGYNVFATKEYMSRVRGGTNSITIRISGDRIFNQNGEPDIFIPFDLNAYERYKNDLSANTLTIADKKVINNENIFDLSFNEIALTVGDKIYSSMVVTGTVCGIIGTEIEDLKLHIIKRFEPKGEQIVSNNIKAAEAGYEEGRKIVKNSEMEIQIKRSNNVRDEILLSGSESIALGALAGGCDSIFSYPMTPGTGVFTALASWATQAGVVVEQAEDEIAAINMAIGAWYAGGRAMVSTSGGGFALMTEGVSLSGMTETPVVIHLAQRPGPATGLPTRTEQGDLNLGLYAGHGVFARAIFAPGSLEQAYELSRHAFEIADKYQSPVIILTDQYLTDVFYNSPEFKLYPSPKKHIIEASEGYKRYDIGQGVLSPRGIPGYGIGRVCVDSDEHDESGRITEDLNGISLKMKNKRFMKLSLLKEAALVPDLYGCDDYETLFVCWGSILSIAQEAVLKFGKKSALLHFKQVFPISGEASDFFRKAKQIIMIENNQTAQFKNLLEHEIGIKIPISILKYNGLQFTAGELYDRIKEVV